MTIGTVRNWLKGSAYNVENIASKLALGGHSVGTLSKSFTHNPLCAINVLLHPWLCAHELTNLDKTTVSNTVVLFSCFINWSQVIAATGPR